MNLEARSDQQVDILTHMYLRPMTDLLVTTIIYLNVDFVLFFFNCFIII